LIRQAKTKRDIRNALTFGTNLNADNFEELARIDEILAAEFGGTVLFPL
jgi:diaminopimelate decarboxylase